METSHLTLADAVHLAHPLAARIADENGCRVLFIKGPVAEALCLRPHRVSQDVDVWVEPDKYPIFISALSAVGWRPRPLPDAPRILTMHSTTMIHERWPCDIDVHYMYPGLLADRRAVFDDLWAHRTSVEVAGWLVPACGRVDSAAIIALHALRDIQVERNRYEFDYLLDALRRSVTDDERRRLAQLARVCGASQTLAPLLHALNIDPPEPPDDPEYVERWLAWEVRRKDNSGTSRWIQLVRRAPWHQRPLILWRAAFLPASSFQALHPDVGARQTDLWRARVQRFGRGAAALPKATRTAWQVYHRERRTGRREDNT